MAPDALCANCKAPLPNNVTACPSCGVATTTGNESTGGSGAEHTGGSGG